MIKLRCNCGNRVEIPETHVGKPATCQSCNRVLRVVAPGVTSETGNLRGKLVVHKGPHRLGEQIYLGGSLPLDIGKLPGSDIRLQGQMVSRTHCRLIPTETGWRLEDQDSTNGSFVRGQRLKSYELRHGDRIQIGDYVLKYYARTDTQRRSTAKAAKAASKTKPPERPDPKPQFIPMDDGPPISLPVEPSDPLPQEGPGSGMYAIAEKDADEPYDLPTGGQSRSASGTAALYVETGTATVAASAVDAAPVCPSCREMLNPGAKICVACGIDLQTGRPLLTAHDSDPDNVYVKAENIIRLVSWVFPTGIYPFASEAFGTRKPYAVRVLAVITIIASVCFLAYGVSGSPRMRTLKNVMLWPTDPGEPPAAELYFAYRFTNYGDSDAFRRKYEELGGIDCWDDPEASDPQIALAAHNALPPEEQYPGRFHAYQLITHAIVHVGIVHLAGNLLFLLVLGSRVNALLGNVVTLPLYAILAAGAAVAHLISVAGEPPAPMLGASGAVMGLAGMYFVFFPLHKVHMAGWVRWGLFIGFRLSLKMWPVRGFWVVLFYLAFDVIYTALGIETGTAHWAHLGGFIIGAAIALTLLLTRLVNCHGGDIISAILGKHAWAIIGRPHPEPALIQRLP